jgi:hypothetical protein
VGSSQHLRAAPAPDAAPGPESARRLGAHSTLVALVELAYGSQTKAQGALERALAAAGRDGPPDELADLLVFVRTVLSGVLNAEIGASLTTALVEDFTARFEPTEGKPVPSRSSAPTSMPRPVARVSLRARASSVPTPARSVLLVDDDRVGRATLARALMRERWGVRVVESIEDLADALGDGPAPQATIVDVQHPTATRIVSAIVAAAPNVFALIRGPMPPSRELSAVIAALTWKGVPREAPAEELIEVLGRAIAIEA